MQSTKYVSIDIPRHNNVLVIVQQCLLHARVVIFDSLYINTTFAIDLRTRSNLIYCTYSRADVNGNGSLDEKEFYQFVEKVKANYPQLMTYLSMACDYSIDRYSNFLLLG